MKLSKRQRELLTKLFSKGNQYYLQAHLPAWVLMEPCEWNSVAKTLGSLLRKGLIRSQEYGTVDTPEDMKPGDEFTWRKTYWVSIIDKGIKAIGVEWVYANVEGSK